MKGSDVDPGAHTSDMEHARKYDVSTRPLSTFKSELLSWITAIITFVALFLVFCSFISIAFQTQGLDSNESIWRWKSPKRPEAFWLEEFQSVLSTTQESYWNGTYWPTSIQWTGAFLDTLLASSLRAFTNALLHHEGDATAIHSSDGSIQKEIHQYFSEARAYYDNEDTIQIFDAAYDDVQWVVLEWLEAIKFIMQYDMLTESDLGREDIARFAHRAHIFYNIVQDKFDTSLCGGGLTWDPTLATYKNAITNELFVSSSIGMYLYFPGDNNSNPYPSPSYANTTNTMLPPLPRLPAHDPTLLDNAIRSYQWFKTHNFTNSQGLIVDGFHISENQTTCDERNEMVYTYNQGKSHLPNGIQHCMGWT